MDNYKGSLKLEGRGTPPQGVSIYKQGMEGMPLPTEDILNKFENLVLLARLSGGEKSNRFYRFIKCWTIVKDILFHSNSNKVPCLDLFKNYEIIYYELIKRKYSVNYSKEIVRILNLWGQFQEPVYPTVPIPSGIFRARLQEASLAKQLAAGKTQIGAVPMTEEVIVRARKKMKRRHYHWLSISFYFGLRPSEVDALKNPANYEIVQYEGMTVLKVYQSKLVQVAVEDRWKPIPVMLPEQERALEYIKRNEFKRPQSLTIKKKLGKKYSSYSGRKGFTVFMAGNRIDLAATSIMLGHKNIETTERYYTNNFKLQMERIKNLQRKQ